MVTLQWNNKYKRIILLWSVSFFLPKSFYRVRNILAIKIMQLWGTCTSAEQETIITHHKHNDLLGAVSETGPMKSIIVFAGIYSTNDDMTSCGGSFRLAPDDLSWIFIIEVWLYKTAWNKVSVDLQCNTQWVHSRQSRNYYEICVYACVHLLLLVILCI